MNKLRHTFKVSLYVLLQLGFVHVYGTGHHLHVNHHKSNLTISPADSVERLWIQDFRLFRDAVYKSDTSQLKSFFTFPLGGEIWYLALTDKEIASKSGTKKTAAPFTEKDFYKYYSRIFSTRFIKTLLRVKSEALYSTGEYETPELRESPTVTYKMQASFDKEQRSLSLYLNFMVVEKDEHGEVLDGGEGTVVYMFRVLKNGHLRFDKIMLAG